MPKSKENKVNANGKMLRTLENMILPVTGEEQEYRDTTKADIDKDDADKLKCTKCSLKKKELYTHPLLKVLFCKSCENFYGDGEFSLDEDDEDKYCRWCGEGGELYLCSKCICGFCPKCLEKHLGKREVKAIANDDDWICLICNPKPLWKLRHIAALVVEHKKAKLPQKRKSVDSISDTPVKKTRRPMQKSKRKLASSGSDSESDKKEAKRVVDSESDKEDLKKRSSTPRVRKRARLSTKGSDSDEETKNVVVTDSESDKEDLKKRNSSISRRKKARTPKNKFEDLAGKKKDKNDKSQKDPAIPSRDSDSDFFESTTKPTLSINSSLFDELLAETKNAPSQSDQESLNIILNKDLSDSDDEQSCTANVDTSELSSKAADTGSDGKQLTEDEKIKKDGYLIGKVEERHKDEERQSEAVEQHSEVAEESSEMVEENTEVTEKNSEVAEENSIVDEEETREKRLEGSFFEDDKSRDEVGVEDVNQNVPSEICSEAHDMNEDKLDEHLKIGFSDGNSIVKEVEKECSVENNSEESFIANCHELNGIANDNSGEKESLELVTETNDVTDEKSGAESNVVVPSENEVCDGSSNGELIGKEENGRGEEAVEEPAQKIHGGKTALPFDIDELSNVSEQIEDKNKENSKDNSGEEDKIEKSEIKTSKMTTEKESKRKPEHRHSLKKSETIKDLNSVDLKIGGKMNSSKDGGKSEEVNEPISLQMLRKTLLLGCSALEAGQDRQKVTRIMDATYSDLMKEKDKFSRLLTSIQLSCELVEFHASAYQNEVKKS